MLLNCGVWEDSWESFGQQGNPTSQSYRKSVLYVNWKDWCQSRNSILWPTDEKNWLIWKNPDAGKDWRWEEKGLAEDEIVGWHHRLNGHKFEQTLAVGEGQESLVWCSPRGHKELDTTEWLNWTDRFLFPLGNVKDWMCPSPNSYVKFNPQRDCIWRLGL